MALYSLITDKSKNKKNDVKKFNFITNKTKSLNPPFPSCRPAPHTYTTVKELMKETSKVNLVFVIFSITPHHPTFSPFQIVRKTLLEERVSRLKSEKSWLQTFTAGLVIIEVICC